MMISATYPKDTIDTITNVIDNAIDFLAVEEEDMDILRDFITALNNLKQANGVVICKPGEYARMCRAEDKLHMLEGYGVDNWDGYDDAMRALESQK